MGKEIEGVIHVDVNELKEELSQGKSLVVDIRELEEYEEAHIPGVPLVPMSQIADLIEDFEKDKDYVFVCRSGRRSLQVSKFFQQNGIENVRNYEGGMLEWDGELLAGQEHVPSSYDAQSLKRKK